MDKQVLPDTDESYHWYSFSSNPPFYKISDEKGGDMLSGKFIKM